MKKKKQRVLALLTAALVLISVTLLFAVQGESRGPTAYYEMQVQAARQLESCFAAVRAYKSELGIPISEEDLHETGMIGESYTGITTTLGAVEAKRTTAWPDMGALCVRLLYEAGVRPGDTVGAGFSGSFPSMNLALITACESMGVKLVCIGSVGASTYGANNPALTFPEIMERLYQDGLIHTQNAVVTMGGEDDVGTDMDPDLSSEIRQRLKAQGLNLVEEPDYQKNLAMRQEVYRTQGPIQCFVAVGGNLTSMGLGESGISLGQGVLSPARTPILNEESGLVQIYLADGLPVINLLNIKKLAADYGLPFDPLVWPSIGQSAVYYNAQYPKGWLAAGLAGAAGLLLACGWVKSRPVTGRGKPDDWKEEKKEAGKDAGKTDKNIDD